MERDSLEIEYEAIFYALSINAIPPSFVQAAKERLFKLEDMIFICDENHRKKIPNEHRNHVLLNLETGIYYRSFQEAADSHNVPLHILRYSVCEKSSPYWRNISIYTYKNHK